MLKKRFLRRSGRKYEKSWSFGHGVGWNVAKIPRWESEILRFSRFLLARKSALNACKKWKKNSRSCVGGSGYHIKLEIGIFYSLGPYGPRKKRLSYVNFSLDSGNGIVLEIIVKVLLTEKWKKLLREWAKIEWYFCGMKISGFWDLCGINPRFLSQKIPKSRDF